MRHKKLTYTDSNEKIAVREFLFQQLLFKHVIGLPGPDINEYWMKWVNRGCKSVEMYENDTLTAVTQLRKIQPFKNIKYNIGDIINAPANKKDTLYDLDFCCTAKSAIEHIKKFRENFIMTFSTRLGVNNTIKTFFSAREEKILSRWNNKTPIDHLVILTNKGKYIMATYCDTSAMCSIAKIN